MIEFLQAPATRYGPFGNVFFRPITTLRKKDGKHNGHCHNYDHVTFIYRGSVTVEAFKVDMTTQTEIEGTRVQRSYQAPAVICIKKEMWHEFTSLEDETAATCIYALRDVNGDPTEEFDGNMEPYC